ncbi:MAG: 4Fe-4S dicluster domain-containing protein [Dehalococcoidia bacterium]|nr:4Fe-4S dicluster domain-containing protein [Dehalococcoidia bacterium]
MPRQLEKISRRKFLEVLGAGISGAIVVQAAGGVLLGRAFAGASDGAIETEPSKRQQEPRLWVFAVDITKCIGCCKCIAACKQENGVPPDPEYNRTWVERYDTPTGGEVKAGYMGSWEDSTSTMHSQGAPATRREKSFFVPKLCNQCGNPPCVKACPVGATFQTEEGVVLVDETRCIGCKYCIVACPYGARYLHPRTKVADKCTWCYHRISSGQAPACVHVCPTGARMFGQLDDPASSLGDLLQTGAVQVLKPALGTKPKVRYFGLQEGVR